MSPKSKVDSLVGKHVLIGITRLDGNGEVISQTQMHGDITSIEGHIVHITLRSDGTDYTLPFDSDAFQTAPPGEYRLRSTGEVVVNPDFLTTWTVHEPETPSSSE